MLVICAWCKKPLGEKEPLGDNRISHGICSDCAKELRKETSNMSWLTAEEQEFWKNRQLALKQSDFFNKLRNRAQYRSARTSPLVVILLRTVYVTIILYLSLKLIEWSLR